MKIDEQILKRFFQGTCNRSEAKMVAKYLKSHPDILDTLFDDDEWLAFFKENNSNEVPYSENDLWSGIKSKLFGKNRLRPAGSFLKWSAAACFALFGIFLSFKYMQQHGTKINTTASVKKSLPVMMTDSVVWNNVSGQKEQRRLSDGSVVYLEPGAILRYKENFQPEQRLLSLTGKAKFIVAKNALRPFTVISGNISTTAIGTIFSVNHPYNSDKITVRLLRGKVLVKNIQHTERRVYLLPGEVCAFNGTVLNKTVSAPQINRNYKPHLIVAPQKNWADTTYQLDDRYATFKNAQLPVVFDVIGKLYKINITYDSVPKPFMTRSLYTGMFDKTKMLPDAVLRSVTNVNDLNLEKTDSISFRVLPR